MREQKMWVAPVDAIKDVVRELARVEPKVWRCRCGKAACESAVVYARDGHGRVWFEANVTAQESPPYPTFRIDNVEDLSMILADDRFHAADRAMYARWFDMGLREALFVLPEMN